MGDLLKSMKIRNSTHARIMSCSELIKSRNPDLKRVRLTVDFIINWVLDEYED